MARALALHARGQGFDSLILHHCPPKLDRAEEGKKFIKILRRKFNGSSRQAKLPSGFYFQIVRPTGTYTRSTSKDVCGAGFRRRVH